MMQNCLLLLAEIKKRTGASEVTANYRGGGELFVRVDFSERKFSYQQVFNLNQWLTPADEESDINELIEKAQSALKHYGSKPNAQFYPRPGDAEAHPKG